MQIDTSTDFGRRVEQRLRDEPIIWLVTVAPDGTPEPSPVWFHWDGQSVLIFSRPNVPKVRNIGRAPAVAQHFDGDGRGGDIVVMTGSAEVLTGGSAPRLVDLPEYVQKYARRIEGIGLTPETMAAAYSVPIRVTPARLRGH